MGALSRKLRSVEGDHVSFYCIGCDMPHVLPFRRGEVPHPSGKGWTWNMDVEKPVFNPSVLVQWSSRSFKARQNATEFYNRHGRAPTLQEIPHDEKHICHSYVGCNGAKPGEIIYLGDSTHAYSGKTIPLPDFPGEWD